MIWTVVIPVKPAAAGKTRLAAANADRAALARAIALDTIAAAASAARVAEVIVVTGDVDVARAAAAIQGVRVVVEGDPVGLDAAIALGIGVANTGPRAALLGDLPALRPGELDAALLAAEHAERAVVRDAQGTGSTLVTARADVSWISAFGEDSAAKHQVLGCLDLGISEGSTLRRDVDTVDELTQAANMGLGPRTAAMLAEVNKITTSS